MNITPIQIEWNSYNGFIFEIVGVCDLFDIVLIPSEHLEGNSIILDAG